MQEKQHQSTSFGRYASIGGGILIYILLLWACTTWLKSKPEEENIVVPADIAVKDTTQFTPRTTPHEAEPINSGVAHQQVPKSDPVTPLLTFDYKVVAVAGGTFQMGSPINETGRYKDECQHAETVASFSIGKYEVTQTQWVSIMGANPSVFKDCNDCPVENVSWDDVQTFIKDLNKKTGKTYRLPTEAEWEYAARGGQKTLGKIYAGSNDLGSVGWDGNAASKAHPVGQKSPNELGLFDMSGNAWEWCQDEYKSYPGCEARQTGRYRVLRGGSWFDNAPYCRVSYRHCSEAARRNRFIGFRLVLVSLQ